MNADEYQTLAARTLLPDEDRPDVSDNEFMLIWNAMGLAGEAGEVANHLKKGILHRHGIDHADLFEELGDVAWYLAAVCTKLGFDLGEVMAYNVEKLKKRFPAGFSNEASIARVDKETTHE